MADELARHEAARESFGANANREAWDRLHSTAPLLAVAIDQVLSFGRRVRQVTGVRSCSAHGSARRPRGPEALHYRDWFQRLVSAGFSVAGKDPQAVFLTQPTRSPLVRKSTQAGVYQLDRNAPERLRRRLDDLQREMRELTAPTFFTGATDLAAVRAQRVALGKDISRVEKTLEGALQLLDETSGGVAVVRAAAG